MGSEIKPGYGMDRVQLKEVLPLKTPFSVFLSVSTVCNFKCKYCVQVLPKDDLKAKGFIPEIMSWEIFLEAAEQLRAFPDRIKTLFLYGVGEPLTNKLLAKKIAHLKKLDVAENLAFITNGALLKPETSRALIDAGLDTLRISMQGLTAEKYYEVCGARIDFDGLVENIRYFNENKKDCLVYVKIADVALEEGDEEKFYDLFRDISDRMFVEKIVPVFHEIDYTDMIKEQTLVDLWGQEHDPRLVCPICFYTLTVYPNGDVYPCCMESDPAGLGNITQTPLTEIWNGGKQKSFLRMQLKGNRMKNPICKNCTAPDTSANMEDELDSNADRLLDLF
ncbi:MAG: radical SAM protein [bacterium]|nr:radical SAM protein [bacterium]